MRSLGVPVGYYYSTLPGGLACPIVRIFPGRSCLGSTRRTYWRRNLQHGNRRGRSEKADDGGNHRRFRSEIVNVAIKTNLI